MKNIMENNQIDISKLEEVFDSAIIRQDIPCQRIVAELHRCGDGDDATALLERLAARLADIRDGESTASAQAAKPGGRKRMTLRL
jgi:hypothetical protein